MKVYCVIPAYNEEKNIKKVIEDVKGKVDKIIIVDDCSFDKTYEISKRQNVVVLRHIVNRGQGAALQTGNTYALNDGADIMVHFDADGQFLVEEIKDLVEPITQGEADIVFGSRFLEKKSDIPKFKKIIILPLAKLVNKIILGVNLSDPQSGFRAMNSKALKTIRIDNDGSAHCSEIIYKTFKSELKLKETPITVIYKDFGKSIFAGRGRGSSGLDIIKDLILGKFIQ